MNFKKLLLYTLVSGLLFACDDDEQNTTDFLQENVERGAVLRTVEVLGNSIPITIEDGETVATDEAFLSVLLEEQDVEEGALLESVDVFITFNDGSPDEGDSDDAIEEEVFLRTIEGSEFASGPFGLPRYTLTITAEEMLAAVNLTANALFGGDTFTTRLALNLTDGRVFSTDNAGGIITGGFFASPFQYSTPVVCNLDTEAFVGNYLIEETTPYVDGPTFADGTVVSVEVGETDTERIFFTPNYPNYCSTLNDFNFLFVCGEIIIPLQESNCACSSGADFFGPAPTVENYDPADDSVFFITFLNDVQNDCGAPAETTYKFTKQ